MNPSKIIAISAFFVCVAALPIYAQPSLPPGTPPKADRIEPAHEFEPRRTDEGRRDAAAAKAAAAKKSSSSKSRSAEMRSLAFSDDSTRLNRPLIIKSGRLDGKTREQLREDLLVMCRIIEKSAREHLGDVHKAAGIDLLALSGGNRSVRTLYLDDYGVVFTLNVRIPLRNESKPDEPEEKETSLNEEWEETRSELFGQRRRMRRAHIAALPAYDEQDVLNLKNDLLNSLQNAANIRNLKPHDWITIAASGPARVEREITLLESARTEDVERAERSQKYPGPAKIDVLAVDHAQDGGDSTMILRVKKSDLDAVAKKKTSHPEDLLTELGKVVSVQVY